MTDQDLLNRWKTRGDARAFMTITRQHASMVYGTCARILGNRADAEEVSQDCFLHLARADEPVYSTLGAWLHTLATRRSLDRLRSDKRRRARELVFAQEALADSTAEWKEVALLVDECIAGLDEELKGPVVAYFLEQKTQSEIAQADSTSQSTISRRIDKGISEIRASLAKRGVSVPLAVISGFLGTQLAAASPETLITNLGKLAIAGTTQTAQRATVGKALASGGFLVMKKAGVGAIVAGLLLALWFGILKKSEFSTSPEPARTNLSALAPTGESPEQESSDAVEETLSPGTVEIELGLPAAETIETADPDPVFETRVSGRVVWADTEKPAPNRKVRVSSESEDVEHVELSDSLGEFTFHGLSPGAYEINVLGEEVFPQREPGAFILAEHGTKDGLLLRISSGGIIEGRISIAGDPLSDAEIPIYQIGAQINYGSLLAQTDAEGWYRLTNILEGERQFVAELNSGNATKLWSNMPRATVRPGEISEIDFDFPGGAASVEGLILLNDNPAANQSMVITFWGKRSQELLGQVFFDTGEKGEYSLENVVVGNIEIAAALIMEGGQLLYGARHVTARTRPNTFTRADYAFSRGTGTLEGRITLAGVPLSNGRLIIFGMFSSTDEEGYYSVENVLEGKQPMWAELLKDSGKIFTSNRPHVLIRSDVPNVYDFDFPGGTGSVSGLVTNEEDVPMTLRVVAQYHSPDGTEWYHSANTNSEGRFRIDGLPAGYAALMVDLPTFEAIPSVVIPFELSEGEEIEQHIVIPGNAITQTP